MLQSMNTLETFGDFGALTESRQQAGFSMKTQDAAETEENVLQTTKTKMLVHHNSLHLIS